MKSTRAECVWAYLDVEGSARSTVGLLSCQNTQKLSVRESGKSKARRHSSPGLPSTLSPPSYTASPCGQTRPIVWQIRTAVPESRPSQLAASWRPTLADKDSFAPRQRRTDRRHVCPRRGLYYFMQPSPAPAQILADYTQGFFSPILLPEGLD